VNADSATINPRHSHQGAGGPVGGSAAGHDTWTKRATVGNRQYNCDMGIRSVMADRQGSRGIRGLRNTAGAVGLSRGRR